mmetsp:Transcript_16248/g.19929  ORF Transcript_16248/g.19929 Transcript_16248/m.19929 type:complete len:326 (-) Transcript_16248:161-1138(-)
MQGLRTASCQCINPVLQQAIGAAQEGHIANAKTAALLDSDVMRVVSHLHCIELEGIFQTCQGVHRLELIQQHPGGSWLWTLMAEPAWKPWAQKAFPSGDDVDFGCGVLHATSDILHGEGTIAQDGGARILHTAIVPNEGTTLSVAHAITDLSTCCNEFIFTWVFDDTVDLISTWEVINDRGLHRTGDSTILRAVRVVAALWQLHSMVHIQLAETELIVSVIILWIADNLQGRHFSRKSTILSKVVFLNGIAHRVQDLRPHGMVVHTSPCTGATFRCSWSIKRSGELGTTIFRIGAITAISTEVELMAPPHIEGAKVRLAPGKLGG